MKLTLWVILLNAALQIAVILYIAFILFEEVRWLNANG